MRIDSQLPILGLAKAHVMLTPVVSNPLSLRWADGWIFSHQMDSITMLGDIRVLHGSSSKLEGTWTNETATTGIQSLTINENGTAMVKADNTTASGTWTIAMNGKLVLAWDNGDSEASRFYAIHEGSLLLLDPEDALVFHKTSKQPIPTN